MPSLLILDDQIQYVRALERALTKEYVIVQANTLAEAMAKMSDTVSVVLTDIRLSESDSDNRDGLQFVRWVQSTYKDIPIVAMSAMDDRSIEGDSLAAGACQFLRKPIVVSQLRSLLKDIILSKGQ